MERAQGYPGRGRDSEAWREKALEGRNSRRGRALLPGAPPKGALGLAGRRKAPKRVKLAERDGSAARGPEGPGSVSREAEASAARRCCSGTRKGSSKPSGDPGNCAKARASVKRPVTRPRAVRPGTPVDDRKGADGPERGARFPAGETLKEESPGTASGMKEGRQPRACQETAGRWSKPESGTETGVTTRLLRG
jgi:type IV secretory pathway TrbL component